MMDSMVGANENDRTETVLIGSDMQQLEFGAIVD